jgi:hypothetical protein
MGVEVQEQPEQAGARKKAFGIDFIDPLFAVAVHLGFSESIVTQSWFHEGRLPTGNEWFPLLVFILGFVTLVWSWVGYHQSIIDKPLKGLLRFLLDVLLVTAYAVVLMEVRRFAFVLVMLAVVYGLFILWDAAKIQEYPEKFESWMPWSSRNPREQVTVAFFVLFVALAIAYQIFPLGRWPALILAFTFTVAYRLWKFEPLWRWHRIKWKELAFGPPAEARAG